jgi:two-component system, OmpR family, response regulator
MQILVIDDHRDSAEALAAVATELGHEVTVAYDGQTALNHSAVTSFDVVFFDLTLPDVDGRELSARMRADGPSRDACMIAVTGRTDLHGDDFASFDGYLHKPITGSALRHALQMWGVLDPPTPIVATKTGDAERAS